jgi:hypothetical protein
VTHRDSEPPVTHVPPFTQEQSHDTGGTPAKRRRNASVAVIASVAVGSILSVGMAWLGTSPAPAVHLVPPVVADTHVPEPPAPPALVADMPAVHFANPFDAAEIFEFPAGTSETDAREAVAELLLERARDRLSPSPDIRNGIKQADQMTAPADLARRSL